MASRTIRASEYFSTYTALGGNDYVVYTSDYNFDPAVTNKAISGGTVSITNYYIETTDSFYFEIYIGGSLACRSKSASFAKGDYTIIQLEIDTANSMLLTCGASAITVRAYRTTNATSYIGEVYLASTVTVVVDYTDPPELQWTNKALSISQEGAQVRVSWTPVTSLNGAGTPRYILFSGDYVRLYDGTSTNVLVNPIGYDTEYSYFVLAYSSVVAEGGYSNTINFTASSSYDLHHVIRCYLNDSWQDCLIYYYDGSRWNECVAYYYDGTTWQPCSF